MNTIRNTQDTVRTQRSFGARLLAAALLFGCVGLAQAAPLDLMLNPEPDISSAFITVDYNAGADLLTASGFAQQLTTGGSGNPIAGGTFDLAASVLGDGSLGGGTLSIGGSVPGLGFNSGTLLTGVLTAIGFDQANDPLEFLFDVTGGDAAGLYTGLSGIILSGAGFPGNWNNNFSSGPFQAVADVGSVVPVPAAVWLFGSALLGLFGFNARKKQRSTG